MFLRRLTLENVRAFDRLDLPFTTADGQTRKWTLVLGENGCGKSTILRSAALLLAGSEALTELIGDADAWVRLGQSEATLRAELVTADGEARTISLSIRRGEGLKGVFAGNVESLDQLDRALAHSLRNYFTVGYGVSRHTSGNGPSGFQPTEMYRNPRSQSVASLFSSDAVLNPLEFWAMDLDYRRGKAGIAVVRRALDGLLPNATFDGIDRERRQVMFQTPDGLLPLAALSDGYQTVAGWCGDLLYRITNVFEDYANPLSARGLLLLDELDLHLHPVWKRQLVTFLTEKLPNFQIVTTTHSALTVHQAGEGELFVLRRPTPSSPPELVPFPGAPRNLMLQQLLVSPLFGLETGYSVQVEEARGEYLALQQKGDGLSRGERRKLNRLERELADLPTWRDMTSAPQDDAQAAMLADVKRILESRSS